MKTNLPVKANGEKTEPFIPITSTKHSGDRCIVRSSKADDRQTGEKGEYPFREEFPNKNARGFRRQPSIERVRQSATYTPKTR